MGRGRATVTTEEGRSERAGKARAKNRPLTIAYPDVQPIATTLEGRRSLESFSGAPSTSCCVRRSRMRSRLSALLFRSTSKTQRSVVQTDAHNGSQESTDTLDGQVTSQPSAASLNHVCGLRRTDMRARRVANHGRRRHSKLPGGTRFRQRLTVDTPLRSRNGQSSATALERRLGRRFGDGITLVPSAVEPTLPRLHEYGHPAGRSVAGNSSEEKFLAISSGMASACGLRSIAVLAVFRSDA